LTHGSWNGPKVRHKAEASVSNPLAIDGKEGPEGTVTNCDRPET
jgi:hypothetical protein